MTQSTWTRDQKVEFIANLGPKADAISNSTGLSRDLILAQIALETNWGEKVLPGTNNLFNIKADSTWTGPKQSHNVIEYKNHHRAVEKADFRVYGSFEESMNDWAKFLREQPRYQKAGLFAPEAHQNLEMQATILQKAGYATDPTYAQKLQKVAQCPMMRESIAKSYMDVQPTQAVPIPASDCSKQLSVVEITTDFSSRVIDIAKNHYLKSGQKFEYGRSDKSFNNQSPNHRTDPSRAERDLDRDGRKGVDCSTLVWRALKDAGYQMGATPFTTRQLFQGKALTDFAKQHFVAVDAHSARKPFGDLKPGDILLMKSTTGKFQHMGVFAGYNPQGKIQFLGSQVSTGPAMVTVQPRGYWDGGVMSIVGALRPKDQSLEPMVHAQLRRETVARPSQNVPDLRIGVEGAAVIELQAQLNRLGSQLVVDGAFGPLTQRAVKGIQMLHGLPPTGVVDQELMGKMRQWEQDQLNKVYESGFAKEVYNQLEKMKSGGLVGFGDTIDKADPKTLALFMILTKNEQFANMEPSLQWKTMQDFVHKQHQNEHQSATPGVGPSPGSNQPTGDNHTISR